MRYYRHVLSCPDFYSVYKIDGLLFVKPTLNAFDLISDEVKFKQCKTSVFAIPTRATTGRRESIIIMMENKMLTPGSRKQIIKNFNEYLEFVKDLKICFRRDPTELPYDVCLTLPYSTRFTDQKIKSRSLDKYDHAVEKSRQNFDNGVFLTLTTDPKRHKSLWHANRNFAGSFNRFLSYLQRRLGSRPKYLAVYEYTKRTGLLHAHILFFGLRFLGHKQAITREWERCGQGSINFVYALRNTKNGWTWARRRPRGSTERTATDYLKKYLKKAMYSNADFELFWATNKRWITLSRFFSAPADEKPTRIIHWRYIGSWTIYTMPELIYMSVDKGFYSGNGG